MKKRRLPLLLIILLIVSAGGYLSYRKYLEMTHRAFTTLDHADLPDGFGGYGIDVSHYQGEIDWETFSDSLKKTVGFVYFKVSEGSSITDDTWKMNNEALDSLGILNGGYHFFIPTIDAVKQADNYLSNYTPEQRDLPPVLDIETETLSAKKLIEGARSWLNEVERRTGRKPIIYTSYHLYSTILRDAFRNYYFWVANYSRREERFTDDRIIIWQYTDEGVLPGIENYVDLNYSKRNYTAD